MDAHAHLWDTDAIALPWWRPELGLDRRYTAADLTRAQRGVEVAGQVLVQAAHSAWELEWLRAQAATLGATVVSQREPHTAESPDAVRATGRYARLSLARSAQDWSDAAGVHEVLRTASVVELLCRADQLCTAASVAAAHPDVTFVLDHLGLGGGDPDSAWRCGIVGFAAEANAFAKVSGIARGDHFDDHARRALTVALDSFEPRRLMFGSDWPMSTRWGTYEWVVTRTMQLLPELASHEQGALWQDTATAVYRTDGG